MGILILPVLMPKIQRASCRCFNRMSLHRLLKSMFGSFQQLEMIWQAKEGGEPLGKDTTSRDFDMLNLLEEQRKHFRQPPLQQSCHLLSPHTPITREMLGSSSAVAVKSCRGSLSPPPCLCLMLPCRQGYNIVSWDDSTLHMTRNTSFW